MEKGSARSVFSLSPSLLLFSSSLPLPPNHFFSLLSSHSTALSRNMGDLISPVGSPLSSACSLSPPPSPMVYLSPPPSQDSEPSAASNDLPPARKKRRVTAPPKERRTQLLDLSATSGLSHAQQQSQIDLLTKTIRRHRKIVVIAGAGISTSAGSMHHPPPSQPTRWPRWPNPLTLLIVLPSSRLPLH